MYEIIIFFLLSIVELVYFCIADHFNIIDKPNERSSHSSIVLRGGGIIYLIGAWIYAAFFGFELWPTLLGLTLVAGVSFIDDIHSLPDCTRLIAQFVAIGMMFYQWDILHFESWWIVILCLILCVGIINAYNFMDGINGINGGYSLAVLLPLLYLNKKFQFVDGNLIIVIILADLVFCFFNFRPRGKAKCFAGDVGSVGIAFILIYMLGALILKTHDFTYILFLAIYGVDSMLTIGHRMMLHEHLGEAHRKHAYQIMANELKMSHVTVSMLYTLLQLAISIGLIFISDNIIVHWIYFVIALIVLCCAYLFFIKKYYYLHEDYLNKLKTDRRGIN